MTARSVSMGQVSGCLSRDGGDRVSAATLRTLDEVREALSSKLGANTASLGPISTRVLMRTGASIKTPRPDQNTDTALIAKAVAALAEMGYPL
jgi:hypothetical protein